MQLILGGNGQQVVSALAEGGGHQRSARKVIYRVLVGDLFGQGRTSGFRQQLVVRHDGGKAQRFIHIALDRVHLALLEHAAGQAAQKSRGHVIRVALNGGSQREQLLRVEHIAQHPVCTQQSRNDAGRGRTKAARHGDGIRLGDLEGRDLLAHLLKQPLCRTVHEVRFTARDAGTVRRRDIQHFALFKGDRIIQRHRQTQRIKAGADVCTGGRDRNLDLHSRRTFPYSVISFLPADA